MLYRNGQRCGYITGPALYSRLGLSTQVPKTIAVAANRAAQTKDFGTIRIKLVPRRAPITDSTVPLLGLLLTRNRQDVLPKLRASINPTTRFNLEIDPVDWPEARAWNIR